MMVPHQPWLVALSVAIAIQGIGVFCYPRGASDVNRDVWRPTDAPFLVEARAGLMPPVFLGYVRSGVKLLTDSSR